MAKKFHELTVEEIERLINQLSDKCLFLEEKISLAEADVLRCRFLGRRINVKVDLACGAELCKK